MKDSTLSFLITEAKCKARRNERKDRKDAAALCLLPHGIEIISFNDWNTDDTDWTDIHGYGICAHPPCSQCSSGGAENLLLLKY
ncbi:MAG: hypothetical protein FIB07_17680 [Candidatus Methanoperedens sp.]|nr:hypothetical protein [Candidatus Methanoperedens sp.]